MLVFMRNITAEATGKTRTCTSEDYPWPPRGSEGCDCMEKSSNPKRDFMLIADRTGVIVWYARMTCPIHGPKIKTSDVATESTT